MPAVAFQNVPPVPPRPDWNSSRPTLNSYPTNSSGPSRKEAPAITSKWGIGWRTPTLMILCYILALLFAIAHLMLFRTIDGREADGPQRIAPQEYVTTASNILSNAFGIALRSGLAIAFCQHLWHLLRVQTMKVSTIEDLFSVRTNPFVLLKWAAIRATPTLCICAMISLGSQVATGFPPGAITVISSQKDSFQSVQIPSFNASFMGNGSGIAAQAFALNTLLPDVVNGGFITKNFDGFRGNNLITRIARQVLISGEDLPSTSPCGTNCSYTMDFEGPYMQCANSSSTFTFQSTDTSTVLLTNFTIYEGKWFSPTNADSVRIFYNGTYTLANLNASFLTPLSVNYTIPELFDPYDVTALIRRDNVTCVPGRGVFTVNNVYTDNVLNRTYTVNPISKLINLALLNKNGVIQVPGFTTISGAIGTQPANWTQKTLDYYRDNNYMAITSSLLSWLDGNFQAFLPGSQDMQRRGINDTEGPVLNSLAWEDLVTTSATGVSHSSGTVNNAANLIDSTRFNKAFNQYAAFNSSGPQFIINQDLINDYLFKMTTSLMSAYGNWNTTTSATITTPTNIYSFSSPLTLILPYFLTLALSFPFMVLGSLALIRNGVSATDGGFIQLISTSTGSAALDNAAAGGCLGGSESLPKELEELEIRYGELIGRDDTAVKRAGFGVEREIVPLRRSESYGIARWI
ncbi:hypothetical protein B0J14DRAFT_598601 [Halenospora varia]|nr:hypothetical protein B0J14DRAFT_598601 [Halenospora varia]